MVIVIGLFFIGLILAHGYFYACVLQSKSYRNKEFLTNVNKSLVLDSICFLFAVAIGLINTFLVDLEYNSLFGILACIPPFLGVVVKAVKYKNAKLRFTFRSKVITLVYILLGLTLFVVFVVLKIDCYLGALSCLSIILTIFANSLTLPFFKRKNAKYLKGCKRKLQRVDPLIIAITGSAGKTGVKNILKELLKSKGKVYATPKSYNTPLGISKAVEEMPDDTDVFIVEFGARRKGDIKELCDLVEPDVGVLTCIAPQHLETFGTIEEIAKEKTYLLRSVKESFASYQAKPFSSLFAKNTITLKKEDIKDLNIGITGSSFKYFMDGVGVEFTTTLLGKANVQNLALAIMVACNLGVDINTLPQIVQSILPTPHRLESKVNSNGVTVIDDSYNVNPLGASIAVELLSTYQGRKILTTSGFVELGKYSDKYNREFADFILGKVDVVIILGSKNKKVLYERLNGKIECYFAEDIKECKDIYSKILKKGDALLITADFPEEYCM